MGACLSAQRDDCTECTSSGQTGSKALDIRAPSKSTEDLGHGRRAAALTSGHSSTAPTSEPTEAVLQPRKASAAITRTIGTPLARDSAAQIWEAQYIGGNPPHDSASSTPRVSMDYEPRSPVTIHDNSAATSHVDRHAAPSATATISLVPALKTKGFMPPGNLGRRLRQEQEARSAAERALAVAVLMTAHLACQISAEQDMRRAAEEAARDKSAALTAAEQLLADLTGQLSAEQDRCSRAEDAARERDAALSEADELAANLARQRIIEQEEYVEERDALRAKLAAAEQRAADLARQVSSEREARMAAEQAQAAAAAEAGGLKWDLAAARLRITNLERDISAEQASRQAAEELQQVTLQQLLAVEQRVLELEASLQATEQQAARAIADAQAACLAYSEPPIFPMEALVGPARSLGGGTFGVVHARALDLAVKEASLVGDLAENQGCLAAEARLMSLCRHKNILPLVAQFRGEDGGLAAIAMPRGDHDLFDELKNRGAATGCYALGAKRTKEIGLNLTSALYYLHNTARIVHHDIKLGNIIVMANGVPKVADFGLGLQMQESGSHWQQFSAGLGQTRGTPLETIHPYSALGRWMPGPHDDVWALCIILQICVSGYSLTDNQWRDLDRRLRTDSAGLAEVDAVCSSFGITEPTRDQRLAALQLIWPLQIQPRESGMENLVQVLQLVLAPGIERAYLPPADVLAALHNNLMQIPDYPAAPAP